MGLTVCCLASGPAGGRPFLADGMIAAPQVQRYDSMHSSELAMAGRRGTWKLALLLTMNE